MNFSLWLLAFQGIAQSDYAAFGCETILRLRKGSRVISTRSIAIESGKRIIAGSRGTVMDFAPSTRYPIVDFNTELSQGEHPKCTVRPCEFVGLVKGQQLTRQQIPLRQGEADTIHAAQGHTIEMFHVDPSTFFAFGQHYTAFSRATSQGGVALKGTLDDFEKKWNEIRGSFFFILFFLTLHIYIYIA